MSDVKAYCTKCKTKRVIKDPKLTTTANNRFRMKGSCPVCKGNIGVFVAGKKKGAADHDLTEDFEGAAECPVTGGAPKRRSRKGSRKSRKSGGRGSRKGSRRGSRKTGGARGSRRSRGSRGSRKTGGRRSRR